MAPIVTNGESFFLNPVGAPPWLDWKSVLAEFNARESAAQVASKRYVEAGLQEPENDQKTRPPGSTNAEYDLVDVVVSRCRCGSTNRTQYDKKTEVTGCGAEPVTGK